MPSWAPPPPSDAVRFLEAKHLVPGFDHRDVWHVEHARAFTVAKMMELDLLSETHKALVDAMRYGETQAQFSRRLVPLLQERGWWGRQERVDPATGEVRMVQLGSPRRLRRIYQINMEQAWNAGREIRAQRNKRTHGYARYRLGPSEKHRNEHAAKEGTTLPVDDPFWDTWTPKNGYGCKCWKEYLPNRIGEAEIQRPAADEMITHVNERTGEVLSVPKGIHPSFAYNPGKAAEAQHLIGLMMTKVGEVDPQLGSRWLAGAMRWFRDDVREHAADFIRSSPNLPALTTRALAAVPPTVADRLPLRTAVITGRAVDLSQMSAQLPDLPERLPEVLTDPKNVYWDSERGWLVFEPRARWRRNVAVVYRQEGDDWRQIGLGVIESRKRPEWTPL